jgi:hypothetical protein
LPRDTGATHRRARKARSLLKRDDSTRRRRRFERDTPFMTIGTTIRLWHGVRFLLLAA